MNIYGLKDSEKLSKIKNITIGSISALGTVIFYGAGVNLSKILPNGKPVFIGTTIISFISPYLLKTSSDFISKKLHKKH